MFGFLYDVASWPFRLVWSIVRVPFRLVGLASTPKAKTDLTVNLVFLLPAFYQPRKLIIKECYRIFGGDFQFLLNDKKVPYTGKYYKECTSSWRYGGHKEFESMNEFFEGVGDGNPPEEDEDFDSSGSVLYGLYAFVTDGMLNALIKSPAFTVLGYHRYTDSIKNLAVRNKAYHVRRAAIQSALVEQGKDIKCRGCQAEIPQNISEDLDVCTNCWREMIDVVEGSFKTDKAQKEIDKHLKDFYKEIGYVA